MFVPLEMSTYFEGDRFCRRRSLFAMGRSWCMVVTCMAFSVLASASARATMPLLTDKPTSPTSATCLKWATNQDDDAIHMWGIQENGKSSRDIALLRLALSCLGDKPPEIVGFGSSIGFDTEYCRKHRNAPICKKR
jgi:hypothetical protein